LEVAHPAQVAEKHMHGEYLPRRLGFFLYSSKEARRVHYFRNYFLRVAGRRQEKQGSAVGWSRGNPLRRGPDLHRLVALRGLRQVPLKVEAEVPAVEALSPGEGGRAKLASEKGSYFAGRFWIAATAR
jgi:hypothetical protein